MCGRIVGNLCIIQGRGVCGLGDVSRPHRDNVDGVKAHIELAQPRGDDFHRHCGRRYLRMPPRWCVRPRVHSDHRDQLPLVLMHPDNVAAKAALMIDRGYVSGEECRLRDR